MLGEAMLNGSGTFLREAIRLPTQIAALHARFIRPQWPVMPLSGPCCHQPAAADISCC